LPSSYKNDIDIYIPMQDIRRYFFVVNNLISIPASITILVSRYGLIKCRLFLDGQVIPMDVLYGFYYAGLAYQDTASLWDGAQLHESGLFYIPTLPDEIRISLLKELLHNSRVRVDKSAYISTMIPRCGNYLEACFLTATEIKQIKLSVDNNIFTLRKTSMRVRYALFVCNFQQAPIHLLRRFFLFFVVKYILRNSYHKKLIL